MSKSILLILAFYALLSGCANNETSPGKKENTPVDTMSETAQKKAVVFFGNSLTAGYGVMPGEAFPALIRKKIDSLHLPYTVVNAGVSGETSAGGDTRISWVLRQPMDVFVLELGANDGLRGIPISETRKNLQSIINKVKKSKPAAVLVLCGMRVPPNMGQQYAMEFRGLFKDLATANGMILVPFLLEGVGGELKLNQADGIHPTAEGHRILAENIWRAMHDALQRQHSP